MAQPATPTVPARPEIVDEARSTLDQAYAWLRNDSLEALIAVGVGVGIFLALAALRGLTCRLLLRERDINGGSWRAVAARVIKRTNSFFLAMLAANLVANYVTPPDAIDRTIDFLFTVAAVFQGAIWVRELILGLVERRAYAAAADHSGLVSAMGLIRLLVNVVIWAFAFILVLDNLGVNVTTLIAGLGVGGIAIGLAAQGIFSDLFAALAIVFDKPFRKGDLINVGGVNGTVEAIGLKTTRVRALSGEMVVVSNAKLLGQEIRNNGLIDERRVLITLGVIYQIDPALLETIPDELKRIVEATPDCRFDRAHLSALSPSSIDFELVFHVTAAPYGTMMDAKQAVFLGILKRFAELEIDFAYPSQMSFLGGRDGRVADPHPEVGQEPAMAARD